MRELSGQVQGIIDKGLPVVHVCLLDAVYICFSSRAKIVKFDPVGLILAGFVKRGSLIAVGGRRDLLSTTQTLDAFHAAGIYVPGVLDGHLSVRGHAGCRHVCDPALVAAYDIPRGALLLNILRFIGWF